MKVNVGTCGGQKHRDMGKYATFCFVARCTMGMIYKHTHILALQLDVEFDKRKLFTQHITAHNRLFISHTTAVSVFLKSECSQNRTQ